MNELREIRTYLLVVGIAACAVRLAMLAGLHYVAMRRCLPW